MVMVMVMATQRQRQERERITRKTFTANISWILSTGMGLQEETMDTTRNIQDARASTGKGSCQVQDEEVLHGGDIISLE